MNNNSENQALRAAIVQDCLLEANGDIEAGLRAAEIILRRYPHVAEALLSLDTQGSRQSTSNTKPEVVAATCEQPEAPLSIEAFFTHDMPSSRAQDTLDRSVDVARSLITDAKRDLYAALRSEAEDGGTAILQFVDRYRTQFARLLTVTQLAALLDGMCDVAVGIRTVAAPYTIIPPATMDRDKAADLVERLSKMPIEKRTEEIHQLTSPEQLYVYQALAAMESGHSEPLFTPAFELVDPGKEEYEAVHFPAISNTVHELATKGVLTHEQFDSLNAAARTKSFTIASMVAEDTLSKIRNALSQAPTGGASREAIRSQVMDAVEKGTLLSRAYLEIILRANIQSAISDGQAEVLAHPLVRSGFPYSAYEATHDDAVRDEHLDLEHCGIDGSNIFRTDDPVFQLFRPPWEHGCRCIWRPMTVRQAAEAGIREAQQWLDTGVEPYPPAYVKMPAFEPSDGFRKTSSTAPMSIQFSLKGTGGSHPVGNRPNKYDDQTRRQLIAEILVMMFGKDAEGAAESLANEEKPEVSLSLDVALATPKVTRRYGKQPGPGWTPAGTSKKGQQIWKWNPHSGASTPTTTTSTPTAPAATPSTTHAPAPVPTTSHTPTTTPTPTTTHAPIPTSAPTAHTPTTSPTPTTSTFTPVPTPNPASLPAGGQRARATSIVAYNAAMTKLSAGTQLTAADKASLSTKLTNMPTPLLQSLHAALGGPAAVSGKTPLVNSVKSILSSASTTAPTPTVAPTTSPTPAPSPTPVPTTTPTTASTSATAPTPTPVPTTPPAPAPAPTTSPAPAPKPRVFAKPTPPTGQKPIDVKRARPVLATPPHTSFNTGNANMDSAINTLLSGHTMTDSEIDSAYVDALMNATDTEIISAISTLGATVADPANLTRSLHKAMTDKSVSNKTSPSGYTGKTGGQIDPTWASMDASGVKPKYGAIVSRIDPLTGKVQILLAKPKSYFGNTSWTFAKGGQDTGEDAITTATREIMEESGASGEVIGHLSGTYMDHSSDGLNAYFIVRQNGPIDDAAWKANDETSEVKWVDIDQADGMIAETAQSISDTNGNKNPNLTSWHRDQEVLENAREALIPGYKAKKVNRLSVLSTNPTKGGGASLQAIAAHIRAEAIAERDGLIPKGTAAVSIDGMLTAMTSIGVDPSEIRLLGSAFRTQGKTTGADFVRSIIADDPGHVGPPPPFPPSGGASLVWDAIANKWKAAPAPTPIPTPIAPATIPSGVAPIIPKRPTPTKFVPKTSGIGATSTDDREQLDYYVGEELKKLGLTADQALQQGASHKIYRALSSMTDYSVNSYTIERTLKNLLIQQSTAPLPPQFPDRSLPAAQQKRRKNPKLPNDSRPKLTPDEEVAVQKWTSSLYIPWARALRETGQPPPHLAKEHADLQSAFAKAQVFSTPVNVERHLNISNPADLAAFVADAQASLSTGAPIQYDSYQATSTDPVPPNFHGNVEMRIEAIHGLDIGPHHHHPHVRELLLNHNTQLKVKSVVKTKDRNGNDKYIITYEQLPPATATTKKSRTKSATTPTTAPSTPAKKVFNDPFVDCQAVQDVLSGKIKITTPIAGSSGKDFTLLNAILAESGRADLPRVVDNTELDNLEKQGWKRSFRGVSSTKFTNQFKTQDVYTDGGNGMRVYGQGTYVAHGSSRGQKADLSEAQGYGTHVMQIMLPPTAKVIKYKTLLAKQKAAKAAILADKSLSYTEQQARLKIIEDVGIFAALNNYDAIDTRPDTSNYWVLLNRSIVAVGKDNV